MTMKIKLAQYAQQFSDSPDTLVKINAARKALQSLAQHTLPENPLPQLSFSSQDILSDLRLMPLDDLLSEFRQTIIKSFGVWHLPNKLWLSDLNQFIDGRRVLEIMSGNGVISSQLRLFGNNVIATDNFDWHGQDIQHPDLWTEVICLDALEAIKAMSYDVVILSWAPDTDETDWQVLQGLRAQHFNGDFIVIGEKNGVTNSQLFWQNAKLARPKKLNQHHQPFDFISDQVWLVQ
ncbi:SAM-dependent methyltransferase [Leuconostoc mesenteroides subsp. mesenteroides]|uniref:SAM-dependent methyltransferase n=1 Tax=Leuconostoc mesenteroides TaxID=1245 RepID=UPI000A060647|nr:SAM-dependent methyltransferase [Leuconostoc mesenteroides]ORI96547.1 SAM-dependent methyltransferase [Leuconostoc mesenteroides subsp. mesenteroides]